MMKRIELKTMNQGAALATGMLALPPLVIEGLEDFKGSFDRLCLQAGTAAIEAMLAADAEQLCGARAIAGAWSIVRSAGTAVRLQFGGSVWRRASTRARSDCRTAIWPVRPGAL